METYDRLEQLARASLADQQCPSAERLAEYTLGMLTGTEQLIVAAHVRLCPLCAHDIEGFSRLPEQAQEWPGSESLLQRLKFAVARLVPATQGRSVAPTYRESKKGISPHSDIGKDRERQYVVADIQITLTVAPLGALWRITGQVQRGGEALAEHTVTLRAGKRSYQEPTDAEGFFTFEKLPAGRYTLTVVEDGVQVQIRDRELELKHF